MTLPTSLQSYSDCLDFFERIVDDPEGGRVAIGTYEAAHHFRHRCNQARRLHREQNKKVHAEGLPFHGASEYDPLMLSLAQDTTGEWWVYARRMKLAPDQVELLSEVEAPQ